jgi:hypothetical protein
LTDTPPELIGSGHFGSIANDCAFWMTIGDVLAQNMSIYRNPSAEYPNIYNIPCPNIATRLFVDTKKMIIIEK